MVVDFPCFRFRDFDILLSEILLSVDSSYLLSTKDDSSRLLKALQECDRGISSNNDLLDWLLLAISFEASLILGANGVSSCFLMLRYLSQFSFFSMSYCLNLSNTLVLRFFLSFFLSHHAWVLVLIYGFSNKILFSSKWINFFLCSYCILCIFLYWISSIFFSNSSLLNLGWFLLLSYTILSPYYY